MTSKRVLWGASLALKMEKVPSKRLSKKHEKMHRKIYKNSAKVTPKWMPPQLFGHFFQHFWRLVSRGASTPKNHVFLIKITAFLYKNAVVLANRCVQNYTHGPPSPHKLARRYTGLPAQLYMIPARGPQTEIIYCQPWKVKLST